MLLVIDERDRDPVFAQQIEEGRRAKALMPNLDDVAQRAAADLVWQ